MGVGIRTAALVLALTGLAGMLSPAFAAGSQGSGHGLMTVADGEELTAEQVERYLAAMRDLRDFAQRVEAEHSEDEEMTPEQAQALQAEQAEILDEHGFDQQSWLAAHERIFQAAAADSMRRQMDGQDIEQEFAEQRERIRQHEDLPEEERDVMLEQLDQQMEIVRELQANPDADVVAPYYEEFQEIFGAGM